MFNWLQSPDKSILDKSSDSQIRNEDYLFLTKSLEIIRNSDDFQRVHTYWADNCNKLNDNLLATLYPWAKQNFLSTRSKKARELADNIMDFSAYIQEFPLGSLEINYELAIKGSQIALTVFTFETFPEKWAATQNILGIAYSRRVRGDRAKNLEAAIACFQQSLRVRTSKQSKEDWAETQTNLGVAYFKRIRGERAENLEAAIACYQESLKVYTSKYLPDQWAMVNNNLGLAYRNRRHGDPEKNVEDAIEYYKNALKIFTHKKYPEDWAMTQNNLGNAYLYRIKGEQTENLKIAIGYYQAALEIYNQEKYPQDWAKAQGNLAAALMQRATLMSKPEDLDNAIEKMQQSLDIAVPNTPYFIDFKYNLGNALLRRYQTSKNDDDLKKSYTAYKVAYEALNPEHYDSSQFRKALPATQTILGTRLVREGKWQDGLQLLLDSLHQLKSQNDRLAYANTLYQIGRAYEILLDLDNARTYYRDALRLYKYLQDLLGIAKSSEGLGNVFVFQGHLEQGMDELAKAREIYHQLGNTKFAQNVDDIYQAAQQVIKQLENEVLV